MATRELHVDGHSLADGVFMTVPEPEEGIVAPFVVFDADQQRNIAGPFDTWQAAEQHRQEILGGTEPNLNVRKLRRWVQKLDEEG